MRENMFEKRKIYLLENLTRRQRIKRMENELKDGVRSKSSVNVIT